MGWLFEQRSLLSGSAQKGRQTGWSFGPTRSAQTESASVRRATPITCAPAAAKAEAASCPRPELALVTQATRLDRSKSVFGSDIRAEIKVFPLKIFGMPYVSDAVVTFHAFQPRNPRGGLRNPFPALASSLLPADDFQIFMHRLSSNINGRARCWQKIITAQSFIATRDGCV